MKIIVLGAGKVGYGIAKALSLNEQDVSVVESSADALKLVSEKLDVKPVFGHASDINVLKEAGLKNADILIAVTSSDEINITSCQIAKFMFQTETKIARISKRSYFNNGAIFEKNKLPIDLVVSPEFEIANVIKRGISIPGALDVISCVNDKLKIIGIICKKNAPIVNMKLKYISTISKSFDIAILYIKRSDSDSILPGKNDVIYPGDEVYFVCDYNDSYPAMRLFGYENNDSSNVILIGGGYICEEVVESISIKDMDLNIKIIEENISKAELLSEKINNAEIIHGNPLDADILEAAGIANTEVVVSMTNDDKANVLACLLAKKCGAKRASAVLNDSSYSKLLYSFGINTILDSRQATVSKILHYIRKGGIENILSFNNDEVEILAIDVLDNSHAIGVLTNDITSKDEIYIGAIVRGDVVITLPKNILINAGDKVLFVVRKNSIDRLLKLFQEKPKYLS